MTIHILPTQSALDALADIEQDTGRTLSATGELVPGPMRKELFDALLRTNNYDYTKIMRVGDEL